ncbi:MAG: TonB-dependent receptor [Bacteroidota bacterium]
MLQLARLGMLVGYVLVLTVSTYAQTGTISGTITDAITQEPLIGATVRATDLATKNVSGTVTDPDGNYSLTLSVGTYDLVVSYLGFDEQTTTLAVKAGEVTSWNTTLGEAPTLLETATVSSSKFEKPLSEVTVSLEVLQPELIENTGKVTLDDALQKVPGVTVIDGQANIRGGSGYSQGAGSRVLLLQDDIPILQADAGFPQWGDVPIEIISQVEVIKGAASALYGSSALNGIVNVRTAYATSEPVTRASVFGTAYLAPKREELKWWDDTPYTAGFSASHRQKFGKTDLVLGTYYLNEQSFRQDVSRHFGRLNANVQHRINENITVGIAANGNLGESQSYFYWRGFDQAYQGDTTTLSNRQFRRINVDPKLTIYDNNGNRHRVQGRIYRVNNDNDRNQSNESTMWYSEYQFQKRLDRADMVLIAGVVASGTGVEAELYGDTTFTSNNYAGFLQLDKKLFGKLNASVGLRYEYNRLSNPGFTYNDGPIVNVIDPTEEEESRPVFRFGLNYQAGKATFLRASWGQGYRYPTIAEKFIFTDAGGFIIEPSPALRSETGYSAEVGVKQGYRLGAFEGFVDASAFYMKYEDMMEFNWTGSGFQSQNIGGTTIAGVEFTLAGRGKLGNLPFQLLTGYTYIDPTFDEFDRQAESGSQGRQNALGSSSDENILKYRFRHSFKFDGELELGKFRLGLETFYNSSIEAVDALFLLFIPGLFDFREANPDGAWVHNARLAFVPNEKLRASFLLGNITNKEYVIRPALLEAPRNVTLRMDYTF